MEQKVLQWIQETNFFKANIKGIELQAQFPLGEYIQQLDKRYSHPSYVADFLLVFTDEENKSHKIIIEYDGFEYHFENHGLVNEFNYDQYYTGDHVYREMVLESYGYKFLRINRFNVGKDPIETLDLRLGALVKKKSRTSIH
jgi:very-short-patch-repair endonuclease